MLAEQVSKQSLTPDQEHTYQVLKVLFGGPIILLPLVPCVSVAETVDRPWSEWQKLRAEQEAVNMSSKKIEDYCGKVASWFPNTI
jgi:hypothetical protein